MPIVICIRCKVKFNAKPKALLIDGYFPVCAHCRRAGPDETQRCHGKNIKGEPCKQWSTMSTTRCIYHGLKEEE